MVVLPAPFSPTSASTSPAAIVRLRWRTAQLLAAGIAEADILEDEALRGWARETAAPFAGERIAGLMSKKEKRSSR